MSLLELLYDSKTLFIYVVSMSLFLFLFIYFASFQFYMDIVLKLLLVFTFSFLKIRGQAQQEVYGGGKEYISRKLVLCIAPYKKNSVNNWRNNSVLFVEA